MAKTCISFPISHIIEPILSAALPDTPVSISSNIMAGIDMNLAIIAFRDSIIRDISPPEAHFGTSEGVFPVDENRKATESLPVSESPESRTSTSNTAEGSSRKRIDDIIAAANGDAALVLES